MRQISCFGIAGTLLTGLAVAASGQGIPRAEITLDDSYILGVRASVDQAEIEAARWQAVHGSSAEVRSFAQSLLKGHANAQNAAKDLAARMKVDLRITGDTNDAINWRKAVAKSSLEQLSGTKRDRAFLMAIRDEHAAEITKVNSWYASIAASDSVKAYLHAIMPTLVKHEQTATRLLSTIDRKSVAVR